MSKIDDLLQMKWGLHSETLVCTGEQGEGVIMADTEAGCLLAGVIMADTESGFLLTKDEAVEVAKHIVYLHNASLRKEPTK